MRIISYTILFLMVVCLAAFIQAQNLLPNADLEEMVPNFWHKWNEGQGSSVLTWATDEAAQNPWNDALPSERSYKIEKSAASSDAVGWVSENNADLYWNNAAGNVIYSMNFVAKTMGVNTDPANDDARIGVLYQFFAGGNLLGEQFIPVDQSAADVDWTKYTGSLLVSSEPDSVVLIAHMGKDATGTVWFDNIMAGTDPWSMGVFGSEAETQEGWMNWSSSGDIGYANVVDVGEGAHSGTHAAMLYEADDLADEMVFYSEPVPAKPSTWYALGVWVKTDSANTDPDWYASNVTPDRLDDRMGVTFFYHREPLGQDWNLTGGDQFFYVDQLHDTLTGWKEYIVVSQSPEDAAGVSIRARFTSFPTGYAWYDDFAIQEINDVVTVIEENPGPVSRLIPEDFLLQQNYPNPFNPETIIEFKVPEYGPVELNIYNAIGQKIKTLVQDVRQPGTYQVYWDGTDDYGNRMATGVYLYQLVGQNVQITKKMILIK